jgi:hypothetical protein
MSVNLLYRGKYFNFGFLVNFGKFPPNKTPVHYRSGNTVVAHTVPRHCVSGKTIALFPKDFDKADEKASFSIEKKNFYFFLTKILQNRMKS